MRTYPEDESDEKELASLNAEPWMVELLKLNPSYVFWGPNEDYMIVKGDGWNSPIFRHSWAAFGPWKFNEFNELVNFYFEVTRAQEQCAPCDGSGYNPDTKIIADTFYNHHTQETWFPGARQVPDFLGGGYIGKQGEGWHNKITQDEVDALVAEDRLYDLTHTCDKDGWTPKGITLTAEQVNAWENSKTLGHDAINRSILIRTRAKRLGVYGLCETCSGEGKVFVMPSARVDLVLWWIHPRKGCSRGIEIRDIQKDELPSVFKFLAEAADRNAQRFKGVVEHAQRIL